MQNLRNSKWLLALHSAPVLLLTFLLSRQFSLIKTLLSPENLDVWQQMSIGIATLGLLVLGYAIFLVITKKQVATWFSFLALTLHVLWLFWFQDKLYQIFPRDVPMWMVDDTALLYPLTFFMPSMLYFLIVLVVRSTSENKPHLAWKSFLAAVSIPLTVFLIAQSKVDNYYPRTSFFEFLGIAFFVVISILFLFLLIRGVYIIGIKKKEHFSGQALIWKIPICIILPMIGLMVNNGNLSNFVYREGTGVFGNFNSIWFYILAILNGLLLCWPNPKSIKKHIGLIFGRFATLPFTVYFCLVFLPYLPFAIPAVVIIGLGFLMLTPLVLMVIHTSILSDDYHFLKQHYKHSQNPLIVSSAVLIIPMVMIFSFMHQRQILHSALNFIENPTNNQHELMNNGGLEFALEQVKANKSNRDFLISRSTQPYISTFYNWLVLDNLTISRNKINRMEMVFFGKSDTRMITSEIPNKKVALSDIQSETRFDETQNAWVSSIHLSLTNKTENDWGVEYATSFELPAGSFISDYYLNVNGIKEPGLLVEKKSAIWIFANIRNQNRDPGILYYLTGNRIGFRVFPFAANEIRYTGFEIVHKTPVEILLDGNKITLGTEEKQPEIATVNTSFEGVRFISAVEKSKLPLVHRTPYYHFIVDVSNHAKGKLQHAVDQIKLLLSQKLISPKNAKISLVNAQITTLKLTENWEEKLLQTKIKGGFFLEFAVKEILVNAYLEKKNTFPVIVTITDSLSHAIIENDFADYEIAYPESPLFYCLDKFGKLESHSLKTNPRKLLESLENPDFNLAVFAFPSQENPTAFLAKDSASSIILEKQIILNGAEKFKTKSWQAGLGLHGQWLSSKFYPNNSNNNWVNAVKGSFASRIMSPFTSYIVVENEAQREALRRKQTDALAGNKSLDLSDDTLHMAEPSDIILLILFSTFLSFYYFKQKRKTLKPS